VLRGVGLYVSKNKVQSVLTTFFILVVVALVCSHVRSSQLTSSSSSWPIRPLPHVPFALFNLSLPLPRYAESRWSFVVAPSSCSSCDGWFVGWQVVGIELHGDAAPVLVAAGEGTGLLLPALAVGAAVVGGAALAAEEAAGHGPADEGHEIDDDTDEAEDERQHHGHGAGQDAGQPPQHVQPGLSR